MSGYVPWLLLISLLMMVLISTIRRRGQTEPSSTWWLVIGLVGIIAWLRANQIISTPQIWIFYGAMVTLNYSLTFLTAYFFYRDPAIDKGQLNNLTRKVKVHYVIPVFNEPVFIVRCVQSVIAAAEYVQAIADVSIVVVDDASSDNTAQVLQQFNNTPGVKVINLIHNAGKKGALTAGSYEGENWRDGFDLFYERFGRLPTGEDHQELRDCLREVGCEAPLCDIYLHTDSDSIVTPEFICEQIKALLSDPKLGAISGHCDVYVDSTQKQTLMTKMQVAWYYTQFRIRKASESVFGAVFCVSGPGAGFASKAVFHLLPLWVDDLFGGRIYRGATDRMLTLLVLKDGWKVKYSEKAKVMTVVPSSFHEARKQWTRWKQNFWRMLIPVWQFAWKVNVVAAFLTYSRLIVTILAPFILAYHLVWLLMGGLTDSGLYLAGIAMMGSLMGLAYITQNPDGRTYAILRPFMSLTSAFWGSILTLRALFLTLKGTFTWRENQVKKRNGKIINRWFTPTFELRFLELIMVITIIIYVLQRLMK